MPPAPGYWLVAPLGLKSRWGVAYSRQERCGHWPQGRQMSWDFVLVSLDLGQQAIQLLAGAFPAHDAMRLEDRAIQAADVDSDLFAVFPRQRRLRGLQDAVLIDGFDGNGHDRFSRGNSRSVR